MSQANVGLIRRDLLRQAEARAALRDAFRSRELIAMAARGRRAFPERHAAARSGERRDADAASEYVEQVSATTGMPHVIVRRNMQKIHGVLARSTRCSRGLTRGLDLSVLDAGIGECDGQLLSFFPRGRRAGRRAAEQLAGRAFAVGAGDRAEDAAGAEARQRRAVDAVSASSRRGSRRACRPRRSATTRPITPAATRSCDRPGAAWCSATSASTQALEGRSARRGARPRLQQGRHRPGRGRRLGAATST